MPATLNLVHPSPAVRQAFDRAMAREPIAVRTFDSAEQFLRAVAADVGGCVVVPANLPGAGTRALIQTLRARHHALSIVVLGATADVATAVDLVRAGASEYLAPPVSPIRLRTVVRKLLAVSQR